MVVYIISWINLWLIRRWNHSEILHTIAHMYTQPFLHRKPLQKIIGICVMCDCVVCECECEGVCMWGCGCLRGILGVCCVYKWGCVCVWTCGCLPEIKYLQLHTYICSLFPIKPRFIVKLNKWTSSPYILHKYFQTLN